MKKSIKILYISIFLFFGLFSSISVQAQCPMCKMTGESNMRDGGTQAAGLNKGILYMLAMPYLLVGTIGFLWYRHNKRGKTNDLDLVE
ncbi:MAG TPA: hypothetical protein PK076_13595 [Saprospiraceae bacterium]|nr:hypothetical protein [Saprospiraceae bacterium]HQW57162.1 hypothetical protein [Saprospiraceae bacterium]